MPQAIPSHHVWCLISPDVAGFAEALQGELGGGTVQSEETKEEREEEEGGEDPPQTDTM